MLAAILLFVVAKFQNEHNKNTGRTLSYRNETDEEKELRKNRMVREFLRWYSDFDETETITMRFHKDQRITQIESKNDLKEVINEYNFDDLEVYTHFAINEDFELRGFDVTFVGERKKVWTRSNGI